MSNSKEFLVFSKPEIGQEEIDEVIDSMKSGWLTTGPKAKRFESDFRDFLGDSKLETIAVNSATSGLHLALESLGIGKNDEVIVPTYTFTATAEIVRYLGAIPVFVDVEADTFNMSPASFAKAITPKTKAVIPVHFAGLSCNMEKILQIARNNNLYVVEDAAHSLPTTYNQRLIGTLDSDFTVFSFYANKTMTTGEGGMVVTRDKQFADRCRVMRLHGISRDAFDRYSSSKPSWSYEVIAPGYKYNLPDICAAIGIHQLKRLSFFQQTRDSMAMYYNYKLKELPLVLPKMPQDGDKHAWHLYPIRLKACVDIERDVFIDEMAKLGIGCSVHFIPLHLQPYWRETYNLCGSMFPVAQALYEREVSLPLYTLMTREDQDRVVDAIIKVLSNV